jgi:tricorn protease-like protein
MSDCNKLQKFKQLNFKGEHFDDIFGAEHDDEIIVSTDRGDLFNHRITYFSSNNFITSKTVSSTNVDFLKKLE